MTDTDFDCTGLFDSHAHYYDRRFALETEGADVLLEREVFGRGIEGVINVGTCGVTNRLCIAQAAKYEKMYAAVGIHPEDIGDGERMTEELSELYALVGNAETRRKNKIVAIGEIGLDYHCEGFDKLVQQKCFEEQLEMARELSLPVIVHDREAHGDCFETIIKKSGVRGVFHSFSGSAELANELVKRGWYISFSGVLTFKNARKTVEAAEAVPLERILIETDCPYLAPHPYRGQPNHSGLMYLTACRLAEIKGISLDAAAHATRENVKSLFSV